MWVLCISKHIVISRVLLQSSCETNWLEMLVKVELYFNTFNQACLTFCLVGQFR
jgi:hypothetical protein